jgi:hypothetical protein
MYKDKLCSIQA